MQFTPDSSIQEERLLLVENMSADEILTKVTGREEVDLYLHMHNRHQIIYILSGTLHIEVEGVNHFVTDHHWCGSRLVFRTGFPVIIARYLC